MPSEEAMRFLRENRGRLNGPTVMALDMLGKQAPEPLSVPTAVPNPDGSLRADPVIVTNPYASQRILITYGPSPDTVVVGLERAPDWDLVQSWVISGAALYEMMPVLQVIARIKDMTNGMEQKSVQRPEAKTAHAHSGDGRRAPRRKAADRGGGAPDRATDPPMGLGRDPTGPGVGSPGETVDAVQEARVFESGARGSAQERGD